MSSWLLGGLTVAVVLYIAALLAGWLKFGTLASLDLKSAKITALVEYLFLIHTFLFGQYNLVLLYLALGMSILSCSETLMLRLTQSQANAPIKSILQTPAAQYITVPNTCTGMRSSLIPAMWVWELQGLTVHVGIGLLVALLSDVFDGMAARKLNQVTAAVALSSAGRAAKSSIGAMCHLHETDDRALGDSTPAAVG